MTYDAEFFPIDGRSKKGGGHAAVKRRSGPAIKIAVLVMCVVLLALLGFRVFSWTGRQQEAELLALVNPWNPVEFCGFKPKLTGIGGGHQADVRCAAALEQMLADCAAAGYSPVVCSAYRTGEYQQELYENKLQRVLNAGADPAKAPDIAAAEVARPGTSEHEIGLALDIVDMAYQQLDEGQEDTPTQQWLMANCRKYGFILRYPKGAEDVTGVIYEPWHYRYVGVEAAEQIYQLGITLEEYITMFYSEEAVIVFED